MSKTQNALAKGEKGYEKSRVWASAKTQKSSEVKPLRDDSARALMELYQGLKINLLSLYPDKSIKTILFTGTTHGGGVSTMAINFATTLANNCALKVLLIEGNYRTPCLYQVYKIGDTPESGFFENAKETTYRIKKVGPGNVYVLPWCWNLSNPVAYFESKPFENFLSLVRREFDYIILDAPPILSFPESLVLCGKVDGVILVFEAGKTRQQVAVRAKKELEKAGGVLLGQVLNKKKYYIPEWIYKRL
jgi:protein-tyrosine kinase